MVLLGHASQLTPGQLYNDLLRKWTNSAITFGAVGVDGFFLLSGFLIVQSWKNNPELLNFLHKRVLRIVPGYLVAVILSTLVVGLVAPATSNFFQQLGPNFFIGMLFLGLPITPPAFPELTHHSVNGSLWTITYEFRCYLLVAICGSVGMIQRRRGWLLLTIGLLTVLLIPGLAYHLTLGPSPFKVFIGDPAQDLRLTAAFCIGGSFFLFREMIPFRPLLLLVTLLVIPCSIALHPQDLEPYLLVPGAYLIFYASNIPLRWLDWMKGFPDVSYGIYLYGWPVESLWIAYHRGSPWITFFVSTPVCFGLGWMSWHFVERPMLALKHKSSAALPGA